MIRKTLLQAKTDIAGIKMNVSLIAEYIPDADTVDLRLVDDNGNTIDSIPIVQDEYWKNTAMDWYKMQKKLLAI